MKRQLSIEVEPLSEQRWERIERSLMARQQTEIRDVHHAPNQRRRDLGSRVWMAVAAVAALVVIGLLVLRPAEKPAALDQPSRITTGSSPSHLALPGLALEVQPESAVVVGADTPQGQLLVLDAGSIVCQVAPRHAEAPLVVQAGAVRVRVVGTRFGVTRLGEGARVRVYEGVVEVRSGSESLRVGVGEEWPKEGADGPLHSPPRADESSSKPSPDQDASDQDVSEPNPPNQDSAEPDVGASVPERQKSPPSARESRVHAPKTISNSVPGELASRRSSQEIFEQATALESSDPARASGLYRELESRSDSWAQNALYARGQLALSHGNSPEARRLLEKYLERFPNGSNAEDARAVLQRLR